MLSCKDWVKQSCRSTVAVNFCRCFYEWKVSVRSLVYILALIMLLSGCAAGPDYQRPEQALPDSFAAGEWKAAAPSELEDKGQWWLLYQDEYLSELLQQLDVSNQNLAAAEAAWRMAAAALGGTSAQLYPQLGASADSTRSSGADGGDARTRNDVRLGLNWQLDLWGQVRRQVEAGKAQLQASAAELASMRLSQQGLLVQNYFQLRMTDEQIRILQQNVAAYARVLRISENRYRAGMVTRADVSQALSQLKSAQAQELDLHSQRRRLEHAIAVLLGEPAGQFRLAAVEVLPQLPQLPASIPSSLLERRPDVAAAERRVMAANAEIGVAKSAYFPSFTFGASTGYAASQWPGLFDSPNRYWSFGPQLDLRLFDAGARRAVTDQAIASHEQQVARYRQLTLEAIAEVEDALVQLSSLQQEYQVQAQAEQAAKDALILIENQYEAGMVDFLALSSAQTTALGAERTLVELYNSQLQASVQLIAALGGGWHAQELE